MANNILTPLMITRKATDILHQKLTFVGSTNMQYDDRFADKGGKIGSTLNVRMPSRYNVRTGTTLSAQDHFERSTPLTITSQVGVDVSFTSVELTMHLDDFSERFLEPAITQLAAHIENDCLQNAKNWTFNYTNATTNGLMTYKRFQQGGANLTKELAPLSERYTVLSPDSVVEFNDAVKGLFQSSENIKRQYREGIMGRTGGFDVSESTFAPDHTSGTLAGSAVTNGTALGLGTTTANTWVSQTTLSIDGATSGTTVRAGDIITLSGAYAVHPESKVNTGKLQRFVVQGNVTLTTAATAYNVTVKPALIWGDGNAFQNVALSGVSDTDGLTVTLIGTTATAFANDIQFHKDAFMFGSVDLIDVSKYGTWGARANKEGISMRVAQQYDINSDTLPCRIDVLYGFAPLYNELSSRHIYTKSAVT